jgi:hypothetical protein
MRQTANANADRMDYPGNMDLSLHMDKNIENHQASEQTNS